jgi:RNA polymerase sigma-70 factor (ECF subfamily)
MDRTAAVRLAFFPVGPLAITGCGVTFDDVVAHFQDEVFGLALRITGDRDAADDVSARVFLKAYRAYDRFEPSRPLRNWLLTIAVREAISEGRRSTRERARRGPQAAAQSVAAPSREEPEARAMEREDRERIRRAVAALPELYRVPVVLRYFNDLSVDEIAQVTARPRSTVGVQLLRARAMLREALESAT